MQRSIFDRLKSGINISEIWLLNKNGDISLLYKKNGRLGKLLTPAINESVVISYGIVNAKIQIFFDIARIFIYLPNNPFRTI